MFGSRGNDHSHWSRKPPGGNGQLQPDRPELPTRQRKGGNIGGIWIKKNGL